MIESGLATASLPASLVKPSAPGLCCTVFLPALARTARLVGSSWYKAAPTRVAAE